VPTPTNTGPPGRVKSPNRRSIDVALIVLAALAAILWYLNSPSVVEVVEAEVVQNDGLNAIVNSCGADLSVEVYEDDHLVVLGVFDHRFRIRLYGNDCQDAIHVPLSVPLGERMLIDGSTSEQVPTSVIDP